MDRHEHFMQAALAEAHLALQAKEFPVGCVLVEDDTIVARGRRRNSRNRTRNEMDHAEIVALRSLLDNRPGHDCSKIIVYSTMEPCLMCHATLLLNGIRTMVYAYEDIMGGGTSLPVAQLAPLYQAMETNIIPAVLRQESLALFQEYFTRPENTYWLNSELAAYTLAESGGAN